MNRKYKEIDAIIRGLNRATDAHFKWLVKVLRFVASHDVDLPEITCGEAHNHCEFGSWINEQLALEGGDRNYLLDIDKKHIAVHQACRQLIISLECESQRQHNFDLFETALLAFTDSLTRYKVHLLQLRTSYDALTGQPLRRILDESFDSMNAQYSENGLYLMLLDVDHFKKVNDTYGHLAGDSVLRSLAINLEDNIRPMSPFIAMGERNLSFCFRPGAIARRASQRNVFAGRLPIRKPRWVSTVFALHSRRV